MEIALVALAGIGLLLFIYSFLVYIFAGFKHHPVAGLIAMLPVLNIVTLPSLWHLTGRKLIIGFFGLLIAAGSWMMGAEQGANTLIAKFQGSPIEASRISNAEKIEKAQILSDSKLQGLPNKALYRMVFEPVKISTLDTLHGKTVRIVTKNHQQFEGRLLKIINTKANIESVGNIENNVHLDQIAQLSVMTKQVK